MIIVFALGCMLGYIFSSFIRLTAHSLIGGRLLLCLLLCSTTFIQFYRFYMTVTYTEPKNFKMTLSSHFFVDEGQP